ncbi:MAG: ATP-binding protein [Blastocatellia bacterium]
MMKYSGENRWIGVQAQVTAAAIAEVRITISDRGLGIPAEDLKHIFDPFWRGDDATATQIHGNGLGLHLVKTIINAHGGGISVQSAPGRGSSFTVTLPAIARTIAQPAPVTSHLDKVWGYDAMPTTRTVDVHIGLLRQKLEPTPRLPQYILTVHGLGYKFVG